MKGKKFRRVIPADKLVIQLPIFSNAQVSNKNEQEIKQGQPYFFGQTSTKSSRSPQINRHLNEESKSPSNGATVVFFRKQDHGIVKHLDIISGLSLGTFPFIVDDGCPRKIYIFIPPECDSITQINIFTVHKIILIKQPNFL